MNPHIWGHIIILILNCLFRTVQQEFIFMLNLYKWLLGILNSKNIYKKTRNTFFFDKTRNTFMGDYREFAIKMVNKIVFFLLQL